MKKRQKKKIILCLTIGITILLLGVCTYFIYQSLQKNKAKPTPPIEEKKPEDAYLALGYNEEEAKQLLKLSAEEQGFLKKKGYIKVLPTILSNKEYDHSLFEDYINYASNNPKKSASEVITAVHNLKIQNAFKEQLSNDPYYIEKNLDRYLAYATSGKSIRTVVASVNSNIDHVFYKDVKKTDMSKGNLILVNKYNQLDANYVPNDLVEIDSAYSTWGSLRKVAYDAFMKMAKDAESQGYHIQNTSPFRSYATQAGLYNNYKAEAGEKEADTYSARPSFSEHQTGLALDIKTPNTTIDTMEGTKECTWLMKNAHLYGFILRYPKGKEYLTGYIYEPWHYRYVGVDIATYIYEHDITFEEYYEYFLK